MIPLSRARARLVANDEAEEPKKTATLKDELDLSYLDWWSKYFFSISSSNGYHMKKRRNSSLSEKKHSIDVQDVKLAKKCKSPISFKRITNTYDNVNRV